MLPMSDHSSAVFNNSCVRVPRNPVDNRPVPVFEQKRLLQVENGTRRLSLEDDVRSERERDVLGSLVEFFDSIPEYDDVNHLSNKEFYRRLECLREKQRRLYEKLNAERKWTEEYRSCGRKSATPTALKPFCSTPTLNKNAMKSEEESKDVVKPPSRRSVRIEEKMSADVTPEPYLRSKSRLSKNNDSSIWNEFDIEDFKLDLEKESRSVPSSPVKSKPSVGWKDTITIPQPFQMTVRLAHPKSTYLLPKLLTSFISEMRKIRS